MGVRTLELRDDSREGRALPVEVWYPAEATQGGRDLEAANFDHFEIAPGLPSLFQRALRDARPAPERFPLIVYSHGATSHRRASSELATHLASHGYVVASADHLGNTLGDLVHDLRDGRKSGAPRMGSLQASAADRPRDVVLVMDGLLGGVDAEVSARVDASRVGTCGVSFGGWTTLAANSIDSRPRASFPIVPAWGPGPLKTEQLAALVRLDDWRRAVPTFVLAAERDALIPLSALRDLHAKLAGPKRMGVLRNAGHVHFVDGAERRHEELRSMWSSGQLPVLDAELDFAAIAEASRPFSELCPAEHGDEVVKALCLAHMDAHLKEDPEATAWLAGDLAGAFAARGVELEIL